MSKEEYGEINNALTARSFGISLILMVILIFLGNLTFLYTSRGEVISTVMLPFFFYALVNALLAKINPRLKLTPAEMTVLYVVFLLTAGIGPVALGDVFPDYIEKTFIASGMTRIEDWISDYLGNWLPTYMFPSSSETLDIFYNGLSPGQVLPIGEFVVPILFWSAYLLLTYFLIIFLAFGLWGERWVREERLLFPMQLPILYVIKASTGMDKETGKVEWFSSRISEYKIFWVCFVIGIATSALPLLAQFFPIIPAGGQEYGATPIDFTPLAAVLPGMMARGTLQIDQVALWILLPTNSLATFIIVWLGFAVIYPTIAIQTGMMPYQPGIEFVWSFEDTPGNWYPFPYEVMWVGVVLGFGVVTLWSLRGRFRTLYRALTGEDKIENGLSLRAVTIFGIIVVALILIMFVGVGIPPLIAVLMILFAFIVYTVLGKLTSMFWFHAIDFVQWGGHSLWWSLGAKLGYWPSAPGLETMTPAGLATATMQIPFNGCWSLRCCGPSPGGIAGIYKIAREAKANLKQVFIGTIVLLVVGVPFSFFTYLWILAHGGGVTHTNSWAPWVHWWKYWFGVFSWNSTGITDEYSYFANLPWFGLGFIVFMIIYLLRMKVPGFFIDPAAFAFAVPYTDYIWLNALVALILRLILIRAVGPTRLSRYIISISAGLVWGYAAPTLLAWFAEFTSVILPTFQSYYVP